MKIARNLFKKSALLLSFLRFIFNLVKLPKKRHNKFDTYFSKIEKHRVNF